MPIVLLVVGSVLANKSISCLSPAIIFSICCLWAHAKSSSYKSPLSTFESKGEQFSGVLSEYVGSTGCVVSMDGLPLELLGMTSSLPCVIAMLFRVDLLRLLDVFGAVSSGGTMLDLLLVRAVRDPSLLAYPLVAVVFTAGTSGAGSFTNNLETASGEVGLLLAEGFASFFISFTRSAYRSVFNVCSQELELGEMFAIMTVRAFFPMNESLSTEVNFDPLKGTWPASISSARMHSFSASKLLLISAPSIRVCLSFSYVSAPRSLPARSINESFPTVFIGTLSLSPPYLALIFLLFLAAMVSSLGTRMEKVMIECDLEDSSFAPVDPVDLEQAA
mmetsp:Transcript_8531/g.17065  ORF Transcript_8531/g.17065 Transcript_8531/m.17065 type:complete len:333 (-) Transcript_8531:769-1767(-)